MGTHVIGCNNHFFIQFVMHSELVENFLKQDTRRRDHGKFCDCIAIRSRHPGDGERLCPHHWGNADGRAPQPVDTAHDVADDVPSSWRGLRLDRTRHPGMGPLGTKLNTEQQGFEAMRTLCNKRNATG